MNVVYTYKRTPLKYVIILIPFVWSHYAMQCIGGL